VSSSLSAVDERWESHRGDLSSGKSAAGRWGKLEGASVSMEAEVKPEASLLASPRGELPSDAA
jgi:hypothetical protein